MLARCLFDVVDLVCAKEKVNMQNCSGFCRIKHIAYGDVQMYSFEKKVARQLTAQYEAQRAINSAVIDV